MLLYHRAVNRMLGVQGSQLHYFDHEVMRFFAEQVLHRSYEVLSPSDRTRLTAFSFDPATRTISRPADPLTPLALQDPPTRVAEARRLAAALVRGSRAAAGRQPLFHIPRLGPCGIVIHARDAATVVVRRRPRGVWKLARDASRQAVLDCEREGARLAPALAPAVLEWMPAGETTPGYVRLEYTLDTEPIAAADLPGVLRLITPALMEARRASGVAAVAAGALDDDLRRCECALASRERTPLMSSALDVLASIRRGLERHVPAAGALLPRAFAHGDIQASNLRRSGPRVRLIDWGNAGMHHVLFDAFIVELFSPTPDVWHDVLVKGTLDLDRGFRGWLPEYLARLAAATGIHLSPPEAALGLIASMAEKTMAIVARHAADEARGRQSLARIERLLACAGD